MRTLFSIFFFLLILQTPLRAEIYYFSNPSCLVLEKDGIEWREVNAPIIPFGEGLQGSASAKREDLIIIQRSEKIYAFPRNCLKSEEEKLDEIIIGGLPLPSYLPPPPSMIPPGRLSKGSSFNFSSRNIIFSAFLSLTGWQEEYQLKSAGTNYDLRANIIGFNHGGRVSYKLNSKWTVDGDLGFLAGNREVSGIQGSPISYYIANGFLWGVNFTPRVRVHILKQPLITFAVSTPVIFRQLDLPLPPGGYTSDTKSPVFIGALLESRFRFGHIEVSPQLGFYRELTTMAWNLELSYIF